MGRLIILVVACVLLFGCTSSESVVGGSEIDGEFSAFVNLRKKSLERVEIDVYEDFTCPACQNFEELIIPWLQKSYGQQISVKRHYFAGMKSPISAMILYKTAGARRKEEVIAAELFKLKLDHRNEKENEQKVLALAEHNELKEAFLIASRNTQLAQQIKDEWATEGANISYFPSVVIEGTIITTADPENLRTILDSLLKTPPRHTEEVPRIRFE